MNSFIFELSSRRRGRRKHDQPMAFGFKRRFLRIRVPSLDGGRERSLWRPRWAIPTHDILADPSTRIASFAPLLADASQHSKQI